jgi:hypothetical protein
LRDVTIHWRRWNGYVSALCVLFSLGLLAVVLTTPAFWAVDGNWLGLAVLLLVFALLLNLFLRRAYGALAGRPAIVVQAGGLLLSDGYAVRFTPWSDIELLRLTRSRIAIDLRLGVEGRSAWLFMSELGLAPRLRYLYAAIDLDKRGFVEAVRVRAPEDFRVVVTR